eukprot:3926585-Rhodomonas_salina.1
MSGERKGNTTEERHCSRHKGDAPTGSIAASSVQQAVASSSAPGFGAAEESARESSDEGLFSENPLLGSAW